MIITIAAALLGLFSFVIDPYCKDIRGLLVGLASLGLLVLA